MWVRRRASAAGRLIVLVPALLLAAGRAGAQEAPPDAAQAITLSDYLKLVFDSGPAAESLRQDERRFALEQALEAASAAPRLTLAGAASSPGAPSPNTTPPVAGRVTLSLSRGGGMAGAPGASGPAASATPAEPAWSRRAWPRRAPVPRRPSSPRPSSPIRLTTSAGPRWPRPLRRPSTSAHPTRSSHTPPGKRSISGHPGLLAPGAPACPEVVEARRESPPSSSPSTGCASPGSSSPRCWGWTCGRTSRRDPVSSPPACAVADLATQLVQQSRGRYRPMELSRSRRICGSLMATREAMPSAATMPATNA